MTAFNGTAQSYDANGNLYLGLHDHIQLGRSRNQLTSRSVAPTRPPSYTIRQGVAHKRPSMASLLSSSTTA